MRLGGRSCETSGEQMPLQYARSMTNRSYISRHLRYHLYIQDAVRVGPELFSVFSRGAHTECWAIGLFYHVRTTDFCQLRTGFCKLRTENHPPREIKKTKI